MHIFSLLFPLLLQIPSLPEFIISTENSLTESFQNGELVYINNTDTVHFHIDCRRRGASSMIYDKPAMAIKLKDEQGENLDFSFLGMREDNYWVLDAMAIDCARMRNRAAMDLWLEMAPPVWYHQEEPKAKNGCSGQFISVVLNDKPMGIYHLLERLDRKQLKLKKYDAKKQQFRGVLYKTYIWGNVSFNPFSDPEPTNNQSTWAGWEISYPDPDDEPITWEPLMNFYHFIVDSDSTTFANQIADYLDIPTFIDYQLFIQLLSARDNAGKNNYWSFYNIQSSPRAMISLWDIDHSWGRMYDGNEEESDYILGEGNNIQRKLRLYYPHYNETIKTRYAELRSHIFTIQHLDSIFLPYFELFAVTQMDKTEQTLWSGHNNITFDIPSEKDYIHQWLQKRLVFLDLYYDYSTITTSFIKTNNDNRPLKLLLPNGNLLIRRADDFYTIDGNKYRL